MENKVARGGDVSPFVAFLPPGSISGSATASRRLGRRWSRRWKKVGSVLLAVDDVSVVDGEESLLLQGGFGEGVLRPSCRVGGLFLFCERGEDLDVPRGWSLRVAILGDSGGGFVGKLFNGRW